MTRRAGEYRGTESSAASLSGRQFHGDVGRLLPCRQPRGASVSNNKVTKLKPRSKPAARSIRRPISTTTPSRPSPRRSTALLADSFALYLKTKNFHWHVSGRISATTTCCSTSRPPRSSAPPTTWPSGSARSAAPRSARSAISPSCRRIEDNDEDFVPPAEMLRELMNDNKKVAEAMRKAHEVCDDHEDAATASLIEIWHRPDREADLVPVRGRARRQQRRPLNGTWPGVNVRGAPAFLWGALCFCRAVPDRAC